MNRELIPPEYVGTGFAVLYRKVRSGATFVKQYIEDDFNSSMAIYFTDLKTQSETDYRLIIAFERVNFEFFCKFESLVKRDITIQFDTRSKKQINLLVDEILKS